MIGQIRAATLISIHSFTNSNPPMTRNRNPVTADEYVRLINKIITITINISGQQLLKIIEKSQISAWCNKNPIPKTTNNNPIQILLDIKFLPTIQLDQKSIFFIITESTPFESDFFPIIIFFVC